MRASGDAAQVGLGTASLMAATLVAVTAASQGLLPTDGLLGVTEDLGEQVQRISLDAAERITPPLEVVGVVGKRLHDRGDLDALNLTLRVPGSSEGVAFDGVLVRLADAARERWAGHAADAGGAAFTLTVMRDPDGSLAAEPPTGTPSDLVVLDLDLREDAVGFGLPPRTAFRVELHAASGAPVTLRLETPTAYANGSIFTLK